MRKVLRYLPLKIKVTKEPSKSPSGSTLFAVHPHGSLAFGRAAAGFCKVDMWDKAFPSLKNLKVLTASAAFYVPVIRELWLATCCIEASKKVAVEALKRSSCPTAVMVYPGGEVEQLMTRRGVEKVYIKKRKGFIKLALERGMEIVPVYAFGENDLFHTSQLGMGFREMIQKKIGVALPLIWGSPGMVPIKNGQKGVTLVFGESIGLWQGGKDPWKEGEVVTQEMIDSAHELYCMKLKELFDKNKVPLGYGGRELEFC